MENFAKDFVAILQYLLPGFVSAWVFYGLTSYPKPSQFERVVQAMIFTLFNQSVLTGVEFGFESFGKYYAIAKWTDSSNLIWSNPWCIWRRFHGGQSKIARLMSNKDANFWKLTAFFNPESSQNRMRLVGLNQFDGIETNRNP